MSQLHLLRTRRFRPLFITQFLGALNDNLLKNALVMLITYKGVAVLGIPSEQMVAASGGIFILPFFLFSAQAGQLADKLEKTRIIRWVKLAEIGIMVIAASGFCLGRFELLLASLFLMGLHSTVFGPLKYSILPQHLGTDELVGGNALVEAGTLLAILVGTIAGGILVDSSARGTVIVSLTLVVCAVGGWLASRQIPEATAVAPDLPLSWSPVRPTWSILKDTGRTKSVMLSVLGVSWFWYYGAILLSLFPVYCKDFLLAEGKVVTLFLSLFSIGIAVGSLWCERLSRKSLELGLVPLGSIGMTLFALDLFWVGAPGFLAGHAPGTITVSMLLRSTEGARILIDLFLLSVFGGFYIVPLNTLVQSRSEVSHRSRVIAGNNILNALFMVMASLHMMAMLHYKLSPPQIFLTLALMNAAVSLYIYSTIPEFFLRFMGWCLANLLYRLRVEGDDRIPLDGPAVLICNHVSFVDWMIIAAGVKRPVRFIMDHSFAKGPIMKMLVRQAKIIPIAPARVDAELMERAFVRAAEELRAGEIVCIFPEGKITYDGTLNPFKPGVERIVRETPVPVIPMALTNLYGSFFSRKDGPALRKLPRRLWARIGLKIGEPVPPSAATASYLETKVRELSGQAAAPPRESSAATAARLR